MHRGENIVRKAGMRVVGIVVAISVIVVGLVLYQSSIVGPATPKAEWRLTVYAQGVEESWKAILEEFKKDYPQLVEYTLYVQSAGKISERFLSEARAGKHIADVIVVQTTVLEEAIKEGLLMYYEPPNAKDLMQYAFFSSHAKPGYYYPYRFLVQGIGINTNYIERDSIKSYRDLTKPEFIEKWKGRVGMADPRYTVSIELFFFLKEAYGIDFWKKIARLNPIWEPKSTVAVDDLASGKIVVLIGALGHLFSETDKPIAFIYPEEGTVLTPVCVAIPKNAPNPEAAKTFVNWLLSKKGAELLVKTKGGDPAYPGLALPGMKPLDQVNIVPQDYARYYATSPEDILKEWADVFGVAG
jgi:iron(III) transport system substrate-binding protein